MTTRDFDYTRTRLSDSDLQLVLSEHTDWLKSFGESGFRADLRNVDLRGLDLSYCSLSQAQMQGADLRNTNLHNTDLRDALLQAVDFRGVDLHLTNLYRADVRNASFESARLPSGMVVLLGERFPIYIIGDSVRVGMRVYTATQWRSSGNYTLYAKDAGRALKFYRRLLDIIDFYFGPGPRPQWAK